MPTAQLPLPVHLRDAMTFANFYPGDNQQVLQHLQALTAGKFEPLTYFWGAAKAGTTHLLQACCQAAAAHQLSAIYISLEDNQINSGSLEGLEALALICLDDLQHISGQPDWEEALFHLYNRARNTHTRIIVAAKQPPSALKLQLKDLYTRLSAGLTFQIHVLDDKQKSAALILRAHQRGLVLADDVVDFILRYCPRDMGFLLNLLDRLDKASLVNQRRLTIPFIKSILHTNEN